MAYPTKYARQYDFQSYQNANPTRPLPGDKVNVDLNQIVSTHGAIIDFIKLFTRSDGRLANGSVGIDQLDSSLDIGFSVPTVWASGIDYAESSTVFYQSSFYKSNAAHTSGNTFDAGQWTLIVDFGSQAASAAASASAAATSETNAAASASAAATSATAAANSATSAGTNATNSANSASAAASSATAAAGSATSAAGSASAAATSASAAATSAADAAASAAAAANTFPIADRATLAATASTHHAHFVYGEGEKNGLFVWDADNHSSDVTNDTTKAIFVAPSSDTTGASGAWVRQYTNVKPEWFGAVGDGVTDDHVALAAMVVTVSHLAASNPVCIEVSKVFATSAALFIAAGNISIIGTTSGAGFNSLGASGFRMLEISGSAVGTAVSITSNTTYGTSTGFAVASATGFAIGDYIEIKNDTGVVAQDARGYFTRIKDLSGTTITPMESVPFSINTANAATVQKYSPLKNIRIENLTFNGASNADVSALVVLAVDNLHVDNLHASGFNGATYGCAFSFNDIYSGSISNLHAKNCGRANNGIIFSWLAHPVRVDTAVVTDTQYPGIGLNWCSASFSNLQSHLTSNISRNIKFFGCCGFTVNGMRTTKGDTAIAIEAGSSNFTASDVIATGANTGWWSNGTNNKNYLVNGFIGVGNTNDISIGANAAGGAYLAQGADTGVVFTGTVIASKTTVTAGFNLNPVIPLRNVITPSFTGTQNSYNPTNLSGAGIIRLIGSSTPVLNGLQGGWVGRELKLINVNTDSISITQASGFAAVGERFNFAKTLGYGEGITIRYDENLIWCTV